MEADAQVSQLEQALLRQAETLAREQRQNAESAKARILKEATDRLLLSEQREILAAKAEAERMVRRQLQAAETHLAAELDRLRWALTESALSGVRSAFQKLVEDNQRYLEAIEQWLAAAAQALPPGDLVAEARAADQQRLASVWTDLAARAAPGPRWFWACCRATVKAASVCASPITAHNSTRLSRRVEQDWQITLPV